MLSRAIMSSPNRSVDTNNQDASTNNNKLKRTLIASQHVNNTNSNSSGNNINSDSITNHIATKNSNSNSDNDNDNDHGGDDREVADNQNTPTVLYLDRMSSNTLHDNFSSMDSFSTATSSNEQVHQWLLNRSPSRSNTPVSAMTLSPASTRILHGSTSGDSRQSSPKGSIKGGNTKTNAYSGPKSTHSNRRDTVSPVTKALEILSSPGPKFPKSRHLARNATVMTIDSDEDSEYGTMDDMNMSQDNSAMVVEEHLDMDKTPSILATSASSLSTPITPSPPLPPAVTQTRRTLTRIFKYGHPQDETRNNSNDSSGTDDDDEDEDHGIEFSQDNDQRQQPSSKSVPQNQKGPGPNSRSFFVNRTNSTFQYTSMSTSTTTTADSSITTTSSSSTSTAQQTVTRQSRLVAVKSHENTSDDDDDDDNDNDNDNDNEATSNGHNHDSNVDDDMSKEEIDSQINYSMEHVLGSYLTMPMGRDEIPPSLSRRPSIMEGYVKAAERFQIFAGDSAGAGSGASTQEVTGSDPYQVSRKGNRQDQERILENKRRQGRLLLVSLLDNFCLLYDQSPERNRKLFYVICKTLSSMGIIEEEYLEEMSSVRSSYQRAFRSLVQSALTSIKQEQTVFENRRIMAPPSTPIEMRAEYRRQSKGSDMTSTDSSRSISESFSSKGLVPASFLHTPGAEGGSGSTSTGGPLLSSFPQHSATAMLRTLSFGDMFDNDPSRYQHEFVELAKLGKGGFASVFKARNKLDGKEYAIKKIRLKSSAKTRYEKTFREIKFLARLEHTNVIRYHYSWMEHVDYPVSTTSRRRMFAENDSVNDEMDDGDEEDDDDDEEDDDEDEYGDEEYGDGLSRSQHFLKRPAAATRYPGNSPLSNLFQPFPTLPYQQAPRRFSVDYFSQQNTPTSHLSPDEPSHHDEDLSMSIVFGSEHDDDENGKSDQDGNSRSEKTKRQDIKKADTKDRTTGNQSTALEQFDRHKQNEKLDEKARPKTRARKLELEYAVDTTFMERSLSSSILPSIDIPKPSDQAPRKKHRSPTVSLEMNGRTSPWDEHGNEVVIEEMTDMSYKGAEGGRGESESSSSHIDSSSISIISSSIEEISRSFSSSGPKFANSPFRQRNLHAHQDDDLHHLSLQHRHNQNHMALPSPLPLKLPMPLPLPSPSYIPNHMGGNRPSQQQHDFLGGGAGGGGIRRRRNGSVVSRDLTLFIQMQLCQTTLQDYLKYRNENLGSQPGGASMCNCGKDGVAGSSPLHKNKLSRFGFTAGEATAGQGKGLTQKSALLESDTCRIHSAPGSPSLAYSSLSSSCQANLVDSAVNQHIFRGIVEGVAYIHEQDMIHRDLKPGNIFLSMPPAMEFQQFQKMQAEQKQQEQEHEMYQRRMYQEQIQRQQQQNQGQSQARRGSLKDQGPFSHFTFPTTFGGSGSSLMPRSPSSSTSLAVMNNNAPSQKQRLSPPSSTAMTSSSSSTRLGTVSGLLTPLEGLGKLSSSTSVSLSTALSPRPSVTRQESNSQMQARKKREEQEELFGKIEVLIPKIGDFGLVTEMDGTPATTPNSASAGGNGIPSPGGFKDKSAMQTPPLTTTGATSAPAVTRPMIRRQSTVATIGSRSSRTRTTAVGTITYASPEQLARPNLGYDQKADIYSLGIIFFELYHPFSTLMERHAVLKELRQGILPPEFVNRWPKEAAIVLMLMAENPADRPTAREILEHDLVMAPPVGLMISESSSEEEASFLNEGEMGDGHVSTATETDSSSFPKNLQHRGRHHRRTSSVLQKGHRRQKDSKSEAELRQELAYGLKFAQAQAQVQAQQELLSPSSLPTKGEQPPPPLGSSNGSSVGGGAFKIMGLKKKSMPNCSITAIDSSLSTNGDENEDGVRDGDSEVAQEEQDEEQEEAAEEDDGAEKTLWMPEEERSDGGQNEMLGSVCEACRESCRRQGHDHLSFNHQVYRHDGVEESIEQKEIAVLSRTSSCLSMALKQEAEEKEKEKENEKASKEENEKGASFDPATARLNVPVEGDNEKEEMESDDKMTIKHLEMELKHARAEKEQLLSRIKELEARETARTGTR